jgi:hypothetical protein
VQPDPYQRYDELSEFVFDLRHPNKTYLQSSPTPLMQRNPLLFWQSLVVVLLIVIVALLVHRYIGP